jgi:hypothetical protein
MKKTLFPLLMVALLCLPAGVMAIDRDAKMIDTISLELGDLYDEDAESIGGSILAETALFRTHPNWSVLARARGGVVDFDDDEGVVYWGAGLGLKYYLWELTTISLMGTYQTYRVGEDPDVAGLQAELKHRLISTRETISPYLFLQAGIERYTEDFIEAEDDDGRDSQQAIAFGGGCDFLMREDMAIVLEAAYTKNQEFSGDPTFSYLWTASVGFKYYWEPTPFLFPW